MNIFDPDTDDGLGSIGSLGLVLVLGLGAYLFWQVAYERGASDVFRFERTGCIVTGRDGQHLDALRLRQRSHVVIPPGATLTSDCLNPA